MSGERVKRLASRTLEAPAKASRNASLDPDRIQAEVVAALEPRLQQLVQDTVQAALGSGSQDVLEELRDLRQENADLKRQLAEMSAHKAALSDQVEELSVVVQQTQTAQRETHIIVHGMPEQEGTAPEVALARACAAAGQPEQVWQEVRRIGRRQPGPTAKPRPLLVKSTSVPQKHKLFKLSRDFRQRGLYMDDDLTVQQQRVRKELSPQYVALRQAGRQPFWRLDRLFYKDGDRVRVFHQGDQLPTAATGANMQPVGRRATAAQSTAMVPYNQPAGPPPASQAPSQPPSRPPSHPPSQPPPAPQRAAAH